MADPVQANSAVAALSIADANGVMVELTGCQEHECRKTENVAGGLEHGCLSYRRMLLEANANECEWGQIGWVFLLEKPNLLEATSSLKELTRNARQRLKDPRS